MTKKIIVKTTVERYDLAVRKGNRKEIYEIFLLVVTLGGLLVAGESHIVIAIWAITMVSLWGVYICYLDKIAKKYF